MLGRGRVRVLLGFCCGTPSTVRYLVAAGFSLRSSEHLAGNRAGMKPATTVPQLLPPEDLKPT